MTFQRSVKEIYENFSLKTKRRELTVIKMQVFFHRSSMLYCKSFLNTVSFSTTKTYVAVVRRSVIPDVKCGKSMPAKKGEMVKNRSEFLNIFLL